MEDKKTLRRTAKASEDAIDPWPVHRSPGDEMLIQIYLATANARLADLESSVAAVSLLFANPISAHFSWVRKRLNQLNGLLGKHFPDSPRERHYCVFGWLSTASTRLRSRQNSFPSGSASTCHVAAPVWPMSTLRAPAASSRSSSAS